MSEAVQTPAGVVSHAALVLKVIAWPKSLVRLKGTGSRQRLFAYSDVPGEKVCCGRL